MLEYLNEKTPAPMPYRGANGVFKIKLEGIEIKTSEIEGGFAKCDFLFELNKKHYIMTDLLNTPEGRDINRQRLAGLVGQFGLSISERNKVIGKDIWVKISSKVSKKDKKLYYDIDFITEETAKEA